MARTKELAEKYSLLTGYELIPAMSGSGPVSLQEFFLHRYNRPSITPELGKYAGETHVPVTEFDNLWEKNKLAGIVFTRQGLSYWSSRQKATDPF